MLCGVLLSRVHTDDDDVYSTIALSVVCGTLTEHTLVKLEIKSVMDKIFILYDP